MGAWLMAVLKNKKLPRCIPLATKQARPDLARLLIANVKKLQHINQDVGDCKQDKLLQFFTSSLLVPMRPQWQQ